MAGFALIFDHQNPVRLSDFSAFLNLVADYKCLDLPAQAAAGAHVRAAKLDAPYSLHPGLVEDFNTRSWLMAAGSLLDPAGLRSNGDLRPLLEDYLQHGSRVFSRLDGQFALVIYAAPQNEILVVSDPFGLTPIYYGKLGSRIYVSTSALAIARLICSCPSELRARAFLLYGDTLAGALWEDVQMLPPATVLSITPGKMSQSVYWRFEPDPAIAGLSQGEAAECILESLSQSLRSCLARNRKVWVSLTGGLDSRTLAALMHYSGLPFKTYCHGPSDSRDVRIAARISQAMGWEHQYFDLPGDWGKQRVAWLSRALGQADGTLDVLKLSRAIREQTLKAQQIGVSLWGYGGEIYRGYYWKQEFWRAGTTSRVNYDNLLDFRVTPLDWTLIRDGKRWNDLVREEMKAQFRAIGDRHPGWPNTTKLDLIGLRLERLACGAAIAAVSGQQRVVLPFYFKENLVRVLSIDYRWRRHSRLFRLLLEAINPLLAEMEMADGGPALPMQISNAHRFLPYWLDAGEKLLWKFAYKYTGKALWGKKDAGPQGSAYPLAAWLADTVSQLRERAVLSPDEMQTLQLYRIDELQALLAGLPAWSPALETLLSRMITLEMALRSTGILYQWEGS